MTASASLAVAVREAHEAERAVENSRMRLQSYLRVRTEELGAEELVTPGVSPVSLLATIAMAARAFCAAPLGWLRFIVCFMPRAIVLAYVYLCTDGDGRMRAICGMLSAASTHVPRVLIALQRVTDIAPLLPLLSWVQLELFGGGGVSTCPASVVAGGGEWLWPTQADAVEPGKARRIPPALEPPFAERRVVLYIHGGAFVLCNPATHRSLTANIARHFKCCVLATTYRRAPQHAYADALDGLLALYRTLLACFPAHGIMLAGESAGANLALALCLRASELHLPSPAGLILVSPWVDLADTTAPSWAKSRSTARGRSTDFLPPDLAAKFADAYAGSIPQRDGRISPLYAPDYAGAPRTLVVYGGGECLSDQQALLVERMREHGVPTSTFVCPDAMHGFPLFADAAYWGWNKRGVCQRRARHSVGADSARDDSVSLRLAQHDSSVAAGASDVPGAEPAASAASLLAGANVDPNAHPDMPGAVQAYFVMRDFARVAWDASRPTEPSEGDYIAAPVPVVEAAPSSATADQ